MENKDRILGIGYWVRRNSVDSWIRVVDYYDLEV